MPKTVKVVERKIADYRPDPANPNAHSERGVQVLEDSLSAVGLGRSIVVDKNGIVLAGNSTQERAIDQGFEDAIEVESDGTKLIVVRRRDLDLLNDADRRARQLTYFDNRSSEVGLQWQLEQLKADHEAGVDLSRVFSDNELNDLLERLNHDPVEVRDTKADAEQPALSDYRIEITCSRADFDDFQATLEQWAQRPGVTLSVIA